MSNVVAMETDHFTEDQVDLIKRTICNGATDDELKLFIHVAKKSKLDPFAKQIHAVKRFSKKTGTFIMAIQVGIDGYRLIAHRTGLCAGISDPVFSYKQDKNGRPCRQIDSATVMVKKIVANTVCEFTATAYWDEYYPGEKLGYMWLQRPKGQLGKCAEALALRKAFPNELSGLYTHEEMEKADAESHRDEELETRPSTDYVQQSKQIEHIRSLMGELCNGKSMEDKGRFMLNTLGIGSFRELQFQNNGELNNQIEKLQTLLPGGNND